MDRLDRVAIIRSRNGWSWLVDPETAAWVLLAWTQGRELVVHFTDLAGNDVRLLRAAIEVVEDTDAASRAREAQQWREFNDEEEQGESWQRA